MSSVVFLVPGSIETPTGGYVYDRRVIGGLQHLGWTVELRQLDDSFPRPTPAALEHAAHVLAGIRDGTLVVVDGLAFGAMPDLVERESLLLAAALREVVDGLPEGGRALVVGHSPTNEAAVLGLAGGSSRHWARAKGFCWSRTAGPTGWSRCTE